MNDNNKIYIHKLSDIDTIPTSNKYETLNRNEVKLLTYNFFLRPPPIKTNESDYKSERLNDFISTHLKEYDIICFQEMFDTFHNRKKLMIQQAFNNGYFYSLSSPTPSFFSRYLIDGGLLILSRFPIVEHNAISFDYGVMSDAMSMKGALYAKIKIGNNYICLFTTHLQASYFDSGNFFWNFCMKTRETQFEMLTNFIYDTLKAIPMKERELCKVIVCGDFNVDYYGNEEMLKLYKLPNDSEFNEYEVLMSKLQELGNVKDLLLNKYNQKPPFTFGVNDGEYDKVLTGKEDFNSKQTLDYIFEIEPTFESEFHCLNESDSNINERFFNNNNNNNNNNNVSNLLNIDYNSVNVQPFTISDRPYQQLSDHFGVSVDINYGSY